MNNWPNKSSPSATKLSIAVVCAANMNRSMEAHNFLANKGFRVKSYGIAERIKLPGLSIDKPNIYRFGTSYNDIYMDLVVKNEFFYREKGLLHMLERNRRIKKYPQRFQECDEQFDVIVTVEERVYDELLEFMSSRDPVDNRPAHVLNINVDDTLEGALQGSFAIADLLKMLSRASDLDNEIDKIVNNFEGRRKQQVLHTVVFY
ncbi:RNA polymerase II subunit A C-terminal domain phosphatase SSU72-like [Teleopsis dalmanni]|uniref:RNA polymerase II subunit A C-terminal domain phosphatase SSU72-like n=1 Tax=Teleopsis dalmanni TaxID=139649 RepID=UPI0018CE35D6|nr:RNA polymerase II subunit A C-terminal domain phosphatase SSU72-like [Teleopsis dalmanni]